VPVTVDVARCVGSRDCLGACAFAAIEMREGKAHVFDNCTDCDACVAACPTQAIVSERAPSSVAAGVLAVDFTADSAIAGVVERGARAAGAAATWATVDAADAARAADAIATAAAQRGSTLVVLPHAGAGPALAGRASARLGANLLSGCVELVLDDAGQVRASRTQFGGTAKATARVRAGVTVATVYPRGPKPIAAVALEQPQATTNESGEKPQPPLALARRIVAVGDAVSSGTHQAAMAIAQALGAVVIEPSAQGKPLAPDLYVAIGVGGSTEHNAVFRNSRVVVAVIDDANAPIVQIADFILAGDVEAHAKALVAAL